MVHPCRLGKFTLFVCSHLHSSLLRADVVEFYCLCERGVSTFVCFLREAAGKECWERRTPLLVALSGSRVGTYLVASPPQEHRTRKADARSRLVPKLLPG